MIEINDDLLAEFLYLKTRARITDERINEISKALKEKGSFATDRYVCAVSRQARHQLKGLEAVVAAFSREALMANNLIDVIEYKILMVSRKDT